MAVRPLIALEVAWDPLRSEGGNRLPIRPPEVNGAGASENQARFLQPTGARSAMNGRAWMRTGVAVAAERQAGGHTLAAHDICPA